MFTDTRRNLVHGRTNVAYLFDVMCNNSIDLLEIVQRKTSKLLRELVNITRSTKNMLSHGKNLWNSSWHMTSDKVSLAK